MSISTNPTLVKNFQAIQKEVESTKNSPLADARSDYFEKKLTGQKMLYVQAAGFQQLHEDMVQLSQQIANHGEASPTYQK